MKFNTRTSCTKDEAVLIMLDLGDSPDLIDIHDQDTLSVKLGKTLDAMREQLVDELTSEGVIQEHISEFLEGFDGAFIKQAREYLIDLDDELAKRDDSALRVLDDGQITLKSLYEWIDSKKSESDTSVKGKKTTPKSENTALITFATLLELFLADKPKTAGFYRNEKLNVAAVARHLKTHANGIEGQGEENIKKLIENAITAKKEVKT
jgi:hypothetical protein